MVLQPNMLAVIQMEHTLATFPFTRAIKTGANKKNDTDHNPGDPWYIAGQPRYPNERYNPATRYTDDEEQANTPIGAEKTHRHTYLEREDFTSCS